MKSYHFASLIIATTLVIPSCVKADTRGVLGGATSVALNAGFVSTLGNLGVTVTANRTAILQNGVASFPIADGVIDLATAKADIVHNGGLTFSAGSTVVDIVDFVIDTTGASPVITGDVIQNGTLVGRITLFDLTLPSLSLPLQPNGHVLDLSGIGVALDQTAATALNAAFNVNAFSGGLAIGTAQSKFAVGIGHANSSSSSVSPTAQ